MCMVPVLMVCPTAQQQVPGDCGFRQKVHLLAQGMVIFSQPRHFFNFLSRIGNNVNIWENNYNLNL